MSKNLIDNESFEFTEGAEKTAFEVVAENVADLKTRMTAAEGGLSTAEGDITSLGTRMTGVEEDLDIAEGNISDLQTRMTAAEGGLSTAEGNITSLGTRMTTAEGKITTAQADISQLKTRMTSAEADISSIKIKQTQLEKSAGISSMLANASGTAVYGAANTVSFPIDTLSARLLQIKITADGLKYNPSNTGANFADVYLVFENGETTSCFTLSGLMAAQGSETNNKTTEVTIQVYLFSGEFYAFGRRVTVQSGQTPNIDFYDNHGTLTLSDQTAITSPTQLGRLTGIKLKWQFSGTYSGLISAHAKAFTFNV